jgi:hypothetical protein
MRAMLSISPVSVASPISERNAVIRWSAATAKKKYSPLSTMLVSTV